MTPLGFKGLDIRSRPLTFQLCVVALWPLVDPIKKTERQDEVFARLLVGREVLLPPIISYSSSNTKGPSARARASYPGRNAAPHHEWDSTIEAFRLFKADLCEVYVISLAGQFGSCGTIENMPSPRRFPLVCQGWTLKTKGRS